jgi:hypothetical protein
MTNAPASPCFGAGGRKNRPPEMGFRRRFPRDAIPMAGRVEASRLSLYPPSGSKRPEKAAQLREDSLEVRYERVPATS